MPTHNRTSRYHLNPLRLMLACLLLWSAHSALALDIKGDLMKKPVAIGDFTLTDQDGNPYTQNALKGKWSLVYFGFTNCAHICPVHMLQLSKFYLQLEENATPKAELPQVVFISVDPARDTPEKVKLYVKNFHKDFIGLTGDEKQISTLESFFSTQHKANIAINGQYQVNHSALVYLVNPQQQMVASFYPPFYIDGLVKDYLAVIDATTPTLTTSHNVVDLKQQPSI